MKIRNDFVTNSSSSNVILALKKPLNLGTIREVFLDMTTNHSEIWDNSPFNSVDVDAVSLTAFASGHSLEAWTVHEKRVEEYFNVIWQKEAEERVKKIGEEKALVEELDSWDRVYGSDAIGGPEPEIREMGLFPKRALELMKSGYPFVYMFDVNDFTGDDDDFEVRLRNWGGHDERDSNNCIKTDKVVLWVQTYY